MLSVDIPCAHIMTCCTPPAPHMVTRACNDSSISAEAGSPRKHGAGGAGGADGACQQDPLTTARTDGGPLAQAQIVDCAVSTLSLIFSTSSVDIPTISSLPVSQASLSWAPAPAPLSSCAAELGRAHV